MRERLQGIAAGFLAGAAFAGIIALAEPIEQAIDVVYDSYRIIIDGADKSNTPEDSRPFIFNGKTYVPLRYISESMGKQVLWDGDTKSIYINDEGTLREDVYFYRLPYLEVAGRYAFDKDNARITYDVWDGTNSISYALNGVADRVYCTFKGEALEGSSSAKLRFYNADNDMMLYETGFITNAADSVNIDFAARGILKLRIEIEGRGGGYAWLDDFRYSKVQ